MFLMTNYKRIKLKLDNKINKKKRKKNYLIKQKKRNLHERERGGEAITFKMKRSSMLISERKKKENFFE